MGWGFCDTRVSPRWSIAALRSSSRSLLPVIISKTYGGRAFSAAAPQLWNTIPEYIKMQTVLLH